MASIYVFRHKQYDENVLVEFIAEDKSGKEKISGWFIHDIENSSVKEVNFFD